MTGISFIIHNSSWLSLDSLFYFLILLIIIAGSENLNLVLLIDLLDEPPGKFKIIRVDLSRALDLLEEGLGFNFYFKIGASYTEEES